MVDVDFVLSEDERIKLISQRSVFDDYLKSAGWINICSLRLEVDDFKCSRCGGNISKTFLSKNNVKHCCLCDPKIF